MKHHSKEKKISPSSIILFGILVIVIAIVWALHKPPQVAPTLSAGPTNQIGPPGVSIDQVKTAGEPFIGNPDAPVTIAYWYDYQSVFCKQDEENVVPEIVQNYVTAGKVKIVFKDFASIGPDSETLAIVARAVFDVAPDKFYDWHKAIFAVQGKENSGWATKSEVMSVTAQVLGADATTQVSSLITSRLTIYENEIAADKTEGESLGTGGTPSMVIGNQLFVGPKPYRVVASSLDGILGL